jgi:hypothetical protein
MRRLAQARNPYSRSWLWIPGSRFARPGMTDWISERKRCPLARTMEFIETAPVICPSGGFSTGLSSLISVFPKNISVPAHPKSHLELFASHPTRGAYRDRHGRRGGMRWTRQRFARDGIAGRVGERPVSDQQRADERCSSRTAKSCGPDAPMLASSSRRLSRPNRA